MQDTVLGYPKTNICYYMSAQSKVDVKKNNE